MRATRIAFIAGLFAGIAAVVACHRGSTSTAAPNDCPGSWQVAEIDTGSCVADPNSSPLGPSCTLPAGWEPIAFNGSNAFVRRCAP